MSHVGFSELIATFLLHVVHVVVQFVHIGTSVWMASFLYLSMAHDDGMLR